jgi:hypothetical protein
LRVVRLVQFFWSQFCLNLYVPCHSHHPWFCKSAGWRRYKFWSSVII